MRDAKVHKPLLFTVAGLVVLLALFFAAVQVRRQAGNETVAELARILAYDVQSFAEAKGRPPKDLAELNRYEKGDPGDRITTSGLDEFIVDFDPELVIDPRSSAKAACVWFRSRNHGDHRWCRGVTDGWSLPSDPPNR